VYKKINDKLNSNDELNSTIENYIKIKTLIYILEKVRNTEEAIEKVINIIKDRKEGENV
jgi:hypothetical protein